MRITESALRRIVREEIIVESLRSGRMSMREGRQLVNEGLLSEGFFDKVKGFFGGKKKGDEKGKEKSAPEEEKKSDPDEIKSMGLKAGTETGRTEFKKGKVYDKDTNPTYKIRVDEITPDASMQSTVVYARRLTKFSVNSYYDETKKETTTELKGPDGVVKSVKGKGDLNDNHGKHFSELMIHMP